MTAHIPERTKLYILMATGKLGQYFSFGIEMHQPYYESMRFIGCEFDDYFNPKNWDECGSSKMRDNRIGLSRKPDKPGVNYMRGVIESTNIKAKHRNEDLPATMYTYVAIKCYVVQ